MHRQKLLLNLIVTTDVVRKNYNSFKNLFMLEYNKCKTQPHATSYTGCKSGKQQKNLRIGPHLYNIM